MPVRAATTPSRSRGARGAPRRHLRSRWTSPRRRWLKATSSTRPAPRAAATIASASLAVRAIGFSESTCSAALERGDGDRRVQEGRHGDADRLQPVQLEQVLPAREVVGDVVLGDELRAQVVLEPGDPDQLDAVELARRRRCAAGRPSRRRPPDPHGFTPPLPATPGCRTRWRPQPRRRPLHAVGQHPLDVRMVVDGIVLVARAEVEDPACAARPRAAAAEDLAAGEARMKISSSGAGIANGSPYISCASISIGLGTPAAIGCAGATVQTSSRSPTFRQRRSHGVPSRRLKIFGVVRGVQDEQAHTPEHGFVHPLDDRVGDVVVRDVPPPRQDVGRRPAPRPRARARAARASRCGPAPVAQRLRQPAAIAPCIPSGYSARTSGSLRSWTFSPHTVTRSNSLTRDTTSRRSTELEPSWNRPNGRR